MPKTKRENQECIVRGKKCESIFGESSTCFIASPDSCEVALELEIIKQKLDAAGIEPYIAVEKQEPQKDIFCEKICSKIIESQFCIVILKEVAEKPNANVYYEYGLMTAFNKKIIPIRPEGQSLAFNIRNLDTPGYTEENLGTKMEDAIKKMIEEEEAENVQHISNFLVMTGPSFLE
ncbi:MAG TPA: hypothetical protein ENG70_04380 [Candidatus Cloacimonetes bacterium]|nr:hypothetical protein [Candidatus Cloacimonadota bacterium]HEX38080.1 hypothetical protein [Candidatus Cloacimonadota bacterium]